MLSFTVEAPMLTVESTTATTISLSWTSAGSVVDSYEVMWERDTSGECPDEDEGSTTITDGSTSYTIMEVEEDSTYTITVTASNVVGSAVSESVSGVTEEAGDYITVNEMNLIKASQLPFPLNISSSISPSHFCDYI